MNADEALKRAIAAIRKVRDETGHFDNGDMASGDIMDALEAGLYREFRGVRKAVRAK